MMRGAGNVCWGAVLLCSGVLAQQTATRSVVAPVVSLPDAPDYQKFEDTQAAALSEQEHPAQQNSRGQAAPSTNAQTKSSGKSVAVPCPAAGSAPHAQPKAANASAANPPCVRTEDPYRRFLNSTTPTPLTPRQKGKLAFRNLFDPFNLLTVVGNAAVTVAADSHTAYGPGWKGFGRDSGYSLVEDATGEFIGTFLVCSIFSEDPHYHRMPEAKPLRRAFHAISRTLVAQNDYGKPMVNYESLIGYTAGAELSNLYVPGVHGNGPSTAVRIVTGLATDPISNLITEFLPDVAKRVHIRIVFVQQIINEMATRQEQVP